MEMGSWPRLISCIMSDHTSVFFKLERKFHTVNEYFLKLPVRFYVGCDVEETRA